MQIHNIDFIARTPVFCSWIGQISEKTAALKRIDGKLVKGKTKREVSNRTVALPAVTIAVLQRHRAIQQQEREWAAEQWKETGYVFTTRVGTPIERRNLLRTFYGIMATPDPSDPEPNETKKLSCFRTSAFTICDTARQRSCSPKVCTRKPSWRFSATAT